MIAPGPTSGFHSDVVHESRLDLIPVDFRGREQQWIDDALKLLPDERSTPFIICTISRHGRILRAATRRPIPPESVAQLGWEEVKALSQMRCKQKSHLCALVRIWPCLQTSGHAGDPGVLHAGSHRS